MWSDIKVYASKKISLLYKCLKWLDGTLLQRTFVAEISWKRDGNTVRKKYVSMILQSNLVFKFIHIAYCQRAQQAIGKQLVLTNTALSGVIFIYVCKYARLLHMFFVELWFERFFQSSDTSVSSSPISLVRSSLKPEPEPALPEPAKVGLFYCIHCKKMLMIFPSPAGMSLTKLSLGGNCDVIYKLFPSRESLVSDIPAGDGKMANLFLQCTAILVLREVFGSASVILKVTNALRLHICT